MSGLVVSSRALARGGLGPVMDSIAHGQAEQRLIFNRVPGVDSLLELAPQLADGVDEAELRLFVQLCEGVSGHNVCQVRADRDAAGFLDGLVVDLHALELSGDSGLLGIRAIAATVRGPLGVLLDERAELLEIADAVRAIDEVLAGAPRAQIFCSSLENLLGGRKYRLLETLDERRRARLAA